MRILHVTTFLQGGAGRVITDLAVDQRRAGHEVLVVSDGGGQPGYESYPDYLERLARAGVQLETVRSTFTRDVALNVAAASRLCDLIGDQGVDIVHAHAAIPSMAARLACRSHAVPVLLTMHGWGIGKTEEQARTDIALLNLADGVATPSAALRERLAQRGVRRDGIRVVPYGIGHSDAAPVESADMPLLSTLRAEGYRIATCVGTIGQRKNQALLVQALTVPGLDNVHAVFVGDGSPADLRRTADQVGVSGRVHILGYRSDASRYVRQADLVVLPSRDEGLPLVVLEALRDEVPVVTSDIPELVEALDGGRAGFVFAREDASGLAREMRRVFTLSDDARVALKNRGRRTWEQWYQLESMTAAYSALYLSLARDCEGGVLVTRTRHARERRTA